MSEEIKDEQKEAKVGFVHQSLQRNNKQIRGDRAADLAEDLETASRRKCEDLSRELKKLTRQRKGMYDFSPSNAQSLALAADVNGEDIVEKDMKMSLDIRDLEIMYEIQVGRYFELYGKTYQDSI